MSRPRVRPTREETRARLFEAAAEVFEAHGIAAASVEDIAAAAGFTRGAVYSNFANKDELVLALLDEHLRAATAAVEELFAASTDPQSFVGSLEEVFSRRRSPIDRSPQLFMEFIFYAARDPANRPRLADSIEHMRAATARIAELSGRQLGIEPAFPADDAGNILTALDIGYSLLHLIDPQRYPLGCFARTVADLQSLWIAASTPPPAPPRGGPSAPR
jgi:AcrR family transcriptional regulator